MTRRPGPPAPLNLLLSFLAVAAGAAAVVLVALLTVHALG